MQKTRVHTNSLHVLWNLKLKIPKKPINCSPFTVQKSEQHKSQH
jgi:hypothetical protein